MPECLQPSRNHTSGRHTRQGFKNKEMESTMMWMTHHLDEEADWPPRPPLATQMTQVLTDGTHPGW